jgi:hypothetical protein
MIKNVTSKFLIRTLSILLATAGLLFTSSVNAQNNNVNYGVQLDTNVIAIGDQINLKLSIEQPKGMKIGFPIFSDSIVKGVEIVKQFPQDTSKLEDGRIKINKNFLITSFDGGVYKLKPFQFTLHGENNFKRSILTDTLLLGVQTMQIDTTKGNFDIVMPIHTPVSIGEVVPWALGGLLCIGILVFLIWYFKYRKNDEPLFARAPKPKEPAHIVALRKLDEIKKAKQWQTGHVKMFYTELTDTLRTYLDDRYQLSTQESITDEIINAVKNLDVNQEWHIQLREILERADLAKFAKYQPLPDENERSLKYAYQLIESTILIEKEEEEQQKEDKETEEN